MPDLSVEDLTKHFPTRAEPLVVLSGVSLALSRGQSMAIVGPSGSGKSTLLHIIGGLDQPTAGRVTLDGQDPARLSEAELARFRNRQVGFIFQDHHLLPQCTVLENVLVPALANGSTTAAQLDRARRLLDRVGLSARLEHRPAELSGGERQRVAIARALLLTPPLLLADEPTGNLDRTTAASMADLLLELHREEHSMLMVVTHSIPLAKRLDRQAELDGGRLRSAEM